MTGLCCMIVVSRPIHTVQCCTKQKETGSLLQCSHINFLTVTQQKHSVFSLKLLLLKSPSTNGTENKTWTKDIWLMFHKVTKISVCIVCVLSVCVCFLSVWVNVYFYGTFMCLSNFLWFSLFHFIKHLTARFIWLSVVGYVGISVNGCILHLSAPRKPVPLRTTVIRLSRCL